MGWATVVGIEINAPWLVGDWTLPLAMGFSPFEKSDWFDLGLALASTLLREEPSS